jgi:hypothetical protein
MGCSDVDDVDVGVGDEIGVVAVCFAGSRLLAVNELGDEFLGRCD